MVIISGVPIFRIFTVVQILFFQNVANMTCLLSLLEEVRKLLLSFNFFHLLSFV